MEIPPIPLQCPFFIGFHAQEGQPNFLPFPLAYGARAYWLVTTRVLMLARHWSVPRTL